MLQLDFDMVKFYGVGNHWPDDQCKGTMLIPSGSSPDNRMVGQNFKAATWRSACHTFLLAKKTA
jgi:hypothetical protein